MLLRQLIKRYIRQKERLSDDQWKKVNEMGEDDLFFYLQDLVENPRRKGSLVRDNKSGKITKKTRAETDKDNVTVDTF